MHVFNVLATFVACQGKIFAEIEAIIEFTCTLKIRFGSAWECRSSCIDKLRDIYHSWTFLLKRITAFELVFLLVFHWMSLVRFIINCRHIKLNITRDIPVIVENFQWLVWRLLIKLIETLIFDTCVLGLFWLIIFFILERTFFKMVLMYLGVTASLNVIIFFGLQRCWNVILFGKWWWSSCSSIS
jgi:hypothetical protein